MPWRRAPARMKFGEGQRAVALEDCKSMPGKVLETVKCIRVEAGARGGATWKSVAGNRSEDVANRALVKF